MKILITGGGTGGHLYPALAVADALKPKLGAESILFVGSNQGMESREVPEAGYAFRGLESVGFPRRPSPRLIKAVWVAISAVRGARAILAEFQPDVIFSTGGYASAPVVFAAWLARLPIVLHEQNSVPGRANRIASRKAARVFLGFSSARRFFPRRDHLRLSGNPLREQVVTGSRVRAIRQFRLEEGRSTVLVLGGSQGAHSINQAMVDALGYFGEREDVQFLIQSGQRDHEWMVERCREQKAKSWVRRFIPNMGDAYEVADLVVARAGAMTISELTACGLPSILVPYPHSMDDHQMLNADQLREGGAAVLIEDRFLTGKDLHDQISALLEDTVERRKMAMNARRMARPDATEEIARSLLVYGAGESGAPAEEDRDDRRGAGARGRDGRGTDRGRRDGWSPPARAGGPDGWREPEVGARESAARSRGGREDGARSGGARSGGTRSGGARSGGARSGGVRRRDEQGPAAEGTDRRGNGDRERQGRTDGTRGGAVVRRPGERGGRGPAGAGPVPEAATAEDRTPATIEGPSAATDEAASAATSRPSGAGRRRRRRRGGSQSGGRARGSEERGGGQGGDQGGSGDGGDRSGSGGDA